MRGVDLAVIYGLIGIGCAIAVASRPEPGRWLEALLLVPFWPLVGPFVLGRPPLAAGPHGEGDFGFLAALERAASTPLGALLPDGAQGRALATRLETAGGRVAEIERLLTLPGFSEEAALARHRELLSRGEQAAAGAALGRAVNIGRLRSLRDRWASEIEAVGELIAQLHIQAEVVRLAGQSDGAAEELVESLVARVEGLDAVLEDEDLHAT